MAAQGIRQASLVVVDEFMDPVLAAFGLNACCGLGHSLILLLGCRQVDIDIDHIGRELRLYLITYALLTGKGSHARVTVKNDETSNGGKICFFMVRPFERIFVTIRHVFPMTSCNEPNS